METENTIIDILSAIDGMVRAGDTVVNTSTEIAISAMLAESTDHPDQVVAKLVFHATHATLFPQGIRDFAIGMGDTLNEAMYDATRIWCEGTLTTLQHACRGEDGCECGVVQKGEMVSLMSDTLMCPDFGGQRV